MSRLRGARAAVLAVGLAGVAASVVAGAAGAPEGASPPTAAEGWETLATRPFLVKSRPHPGTMVKEMWAAGVLAAPAEHLQATILDGESFPRFMPYVKEVRTLSVGTDDGSIFSYQRVAPPLVAQRDCIYHVWLDESLGPDGTGTFRNRWKAAPPTMVPPVPGVVRTTINEGSWEVTPLPGGKSRVVYRFLVDPGGQVPTWAADIANRSGIVDVFRALEREAKRRSAEPQPPKQSAWPAKLAAPAAAMATSQATAHDALADASATPDAGAVTTPASP